MKKYTRPEIKVHVVTPSHLICDSTRSLEFSGDTVSGGNVTEMQSKNHSFFDLDDFGDEE